MKFLSEPMSPPPWSYKIHTQISQQHHTKISIVPVLTKKLKPAIVSHPISCSRYSISGRLKNAEIEVNEKCLIKVLTQHPPPLPLQSPNHSAFFISWILRTKWLTYVCHCSKVKTLAHWLRSTCCILFVGIMHLIL